ncbi:MAG: RNA-binding protein [candidate division Zixibacteria bacterium]|nr:RNA-binding protein [candidate division Zixibacteria bacterium]
MKIYVGHLSPEVTDEDLNALFAAYGQVESAEVVKDRYTGNVRGFGFVVMPTKQEAIAAITALQGQDLKGQMLEVNEARPPVDRRSEGGGGRRPDRGRGGFDRGKRSRDDRGGHRGGGGGGGRRF